MWRLLLIINSFSATQAIENKQFVSSIFESLGYSQECVASSLASCEHNAKSDILCDVSCENTDTSNLAFMDYYTATINDSMADIFIRLHNITYFMAEQQELILKMANRSSTFENTILNEMKEIRDELKSLIKDACKSNTSKEEIKPRIEETKTLINDVKNNSGLSVATKPKNCAEASQRDGIITVYPYEGNNVQVLCDEGWTVIQNRDSAAVRQNFNRSWSDYVTGFGDLNGEFWLGLDNIHALTSSIPMQLRVDLEDYDGVKRYAKYDSFKTGDASTKYSLALGSYSGDAGNSLSFHSGRKFSTYDQDNDEYYPVNCALEYRGGWWFTQCRYANLNGYQYAREFTPPSLYYDGIIWYHYRSNKYSLKKASMKVRPKQSN